MSSPFSRPPQIEEQRDCPSDPSALLPLLRRAATPFLLESGSDAAGMGRWHILGAHPVGEMQVFGNRWRTRTGTSLDEGEGDPWGAMERWWHHWRVAEDLPRAADLGLPDPLPLVGGAVGYIGYEMGEAIEEFPPRADREPDMPDLHVHLYDELLLVHVASGRPFHVHRGRNGHRARRWWRNDTWSPAAERDGGVPEEIHRSLSDAEFLDGVETIRTGIGRGDVYEVNLCRRTVLRGGPSTWELYRRLRWRQPVPYAALLPWRPVSVISASPERFLRRCGEYVETRPIKGTAPRGRDAESDARNVRELLGSAKERAELAMIIDLERNDLGRVCRTGTVEVVAEADLESYATVHHTVATVRGELPAEASPFALLRATFPGGSITGAPKVAAMHMIRDLEPVPRKVYTGSIGWISTVGDLDLSIAIRTVLRKGDETHFSLGGAVTWDSDPERELAELAAKGRAVFDALEEE